MIEAVIITAPKFYTELLISGAVTNFAHLSKILALFVFLLSNRSSVTVNYEGSANKFPHRHQSRMQLTVSQCDYA